MYAHVIGGIHVSDGKLTALGVKRLTKPGHHGDGGGLYFRIADGRRSWMFRYKTNGVQHWLGLGPDGDFSLAEAREAARECRRKL